MVVVVVAVVVVVVVTQSCKSKDKLNTVEHITHTWVDPKFSGLVPPSAQQLC